MKYGDDRLLKTREVLQILGISYSYLKKLINEGKISPTIEMGKNKRKRWLESDVYKFLNDFKGQM